MTATSVRATPLISFSAHPAHCNPFPCCPSRPLHSIPLPREPSRSQPSLPLPTIRSTSIRFCACTPFRSAAIRSQPLPSPAADPLQTDAFPRCRAIALLPDRTVRMHGSPFHHCLSRPLLCVTHASAPLLRIRHEPRQITAFLDCQSMATHFAPNACNAPPSNSAEAVHCFPIQPRLTTTAHSIRYAPKRTLAVPRLPLLHLHYGLTEPVEYTAVPSSTARPSASEQYPDLRGIPFLCCRSRT